MTAQNEPLGEPWVIVTGSPERPVIPLVFDGDAAPKKFSVGASVFYGGGAEPRAVGPDLGRSQASFLERKVSHA
jgi:hypothetical protein